MTPEKKSELQDIIIRSTNLETRIDNLNNLMEKLNSLPGCDVSVTVDSSMLFDVRNGIALQIREVTREYETLE
jgi:hypothetical protein